MPEIGLLSFARVAMDAATAVLPLYRSRFSKHQFTQPQLLAILCLMRYEDWTFREAEVRLREHGELRAMLQLSSVPDHTTVYRFLRRLPDDTIDHVLGESVRRLRRNSRRGRRRACAACRQHLFHTPYRTTCGRQDALPTLFEVADRGRCGSPDHSGATSATRSVVRHPCFARAGRRGQS